MNKDEAIKKWIRRLRQCDACALREDANRGPTQYSGTVASPIMFVGEGPGGVEDIYGVPLVGPSGRLLDKALWSVGITRDRVYVTNIVKCRPMANRTPTVSEGQFCADHHLRKEIAIVEPSVIVALGKVAFQYFNNGEGSIGSHRGEWLLWEGIPVMPTYHPAYLLRRAGKDLVQAKWDVFYDLKKAVEKVTEMHSDYLFQSDRLTDLIGHYEWLKKERQL